MPIKLYIIDIQELSNICARGVLGPRVFIKKIDADIAYDTLTELGCKIKRYTVYQRAKDVWSI